VARRRFFVDSLQSDFAVLSGDDAKHLARVLRAEPGQQYELSDNQRVCLAEIWPRSRMSAHGLTWRDLSLTDCRENGGQGPGDLLGIPDRGQIQVD
jgi:hypothetical protein